MADNVAVTEGAGKSIATDDVGGQQYQRVKITDGTGGSGTEIAAGSGVAAGALRVELPTDGTGVIADITNSIKIHILSTGGTIMVSDKSEPTVIASGKDGTTTRPIRQNSDGALKVYDLTDGTVKIASGTLTGITNTVSVQLDPGHTLGKVIIVDPTGADMDLFKSGDNYASGGDHGLAILSIDANTPQKYRFLRSGQGTSDAAIRVVQATDSVASMNIVSGTITGITNSIAVYFDRGNPAVNIPGTVAIYGDIISGGTDPASEGPVKIGGKYSSTPPTFLDGQRGDILIDSRGGVATVIKSQSGSVFANVTTPADGATNASNGLFTTSRSHVFNGTTWDRTRGGSGYSDAAMRVVQATDVGTSVKILAGSAVIGIVDTQSTASIFTVSGSTSGVSPSGVTLVSPSANYSFKVFAFSLQTTGVVSLVARFTNGGGSATEFWRGLVTANQTASSPVGANLAVQPPGFLFATGTNTTLALHLDTATLVHYSVSYIKETA